MTENEAKFLEKLDELANDTEVDMYSVANLNFFFEESANTIRKLIEEIQQYRAIGTVEYIKEQLNLAIDAYDKSERLINTTMDMLAEYQSIGTIEDFKALKDCGTHDCIIKHLSGECSYKETGCSDCKSKWKIKDLLEKSVAKKMLHNGANWYRCPNGCEVHKKQFEKDWYCPKCGQKMDFGKEE